LELPGQDSNLDKENQKSKGQAPKVLPDNTSEQSAAPLTAPLTADPDLTRVVEAWPALSKAIRRAVLALIGSASN
jgi:hypothetical protein